MFPAIGASNYVSLGGNDHRYNAFMSYPALVSLTKTSSRHTLKTGVDARMIRVNVWEARAAGTFNFSAGMTQGPNPNTASTTAGNAIASLLLGTGTQSNALIQNWKNVASQNFYVGGYMQDDWRVTSRLTLNLGLRYDFETPRTERYDRMNYFDPAAARRWPPGAAVPRPARRSRVRRRRRQQPLAVRARPQQHLAAGRRRVRDQRQDRPARRLRAPLRPLVPAGQRHRRPFGFRTENLWVSTLDGITPFRLLRDPYPAGFTPSPGSSEGLLTAVGGAIQAPLRDRSPTPWTRQWNVTLQRELPWRVAVEAAYVGTEGHDLQTNTEGGLSLNQLDPHTWRSDPRSISSCRTRSSASSTAASSCRRRSAAPSSLRPYPQFTDIIPLQNTGATSIYHALQISVNRRMSGGLLLAGLLRLVEGRRRRRSAPEQLRRRREPIGRVATTSRTGSS